MFFNYKYFYLNWKSNKEYDIQWLNKKPDIFNYEYEVKIKKEKLIFIGNIKYKFKTPNKLNKINYWCYNDSFLKKYLTALIKKQWGQNLLKFRGAKLPGGLELNGRELYDDALRELDDIKQRMSSEYELPPLDLIG